MNLKIFFYFLFLLLLSSLSFSQEAVVEGDSGGLIIQVKDDLIESLTGEFSATFQATPVKDVFKLFATESKINLMISPNINASITANFNKVSMRDALLAILSANNLYYLVQGNIVKIMTAREYKNELLRQYVITKTYDASVIDIKNLVTVMKPMLSPGVGNFSIDAQSSKIIVTDIKDNFVRLDKLFQEISTLPKAVEIETKILELTLDKGHELGFDWTALNIGDLVDITASFPSGGSVGTEHIIAKGVKVANNVTNISAVISAFANNNNASLLSQPKILAVNRQEATIHIGEKVPYVKSVINNTTSQQTTSQIDFIDVGIKIVVTPVISSEDAVKMDIKAEMSSATLQNISENEKAPWITTTELSCNPMVKSMQTIIIGGLIKTTVSKQKKGIPLLMDIPFLGYLFSHSVDTTKKSEMVIFLTPRVLKPGESNFGFKNNSENAYLDAGFTNSVHAEDTNK